MDIVVQRAEDGSVVIRHWASGLHDKPIEENDCSVKLMTYNILADVFVKDGLYTYCPRDMRYIWGRHERIVQEIRSINPDIVNLQEVAMEHFEEKLKPDLGKLGYEGFYMSYLYTGHSDGLAMFYKSERMKVLVQRSCPTQTYVDYYFKKFLPHCKKEDHDDILKLVKKCQGCLIGKFELKATGKIFTIGNIHIKWTNFGLPGLGCLEAACAVKELEEVSHNGAFILTGDFNSTPDSAPYSLLSTGQFDPFADHWHFVPNSNVYSWNGDVKSHPNTSLSVSLRKVLHSKRTKHELATDKRLTKVFANLLNTHTPLNSAYKHVLGHAPEVTNCEAYAWPGYIHELCLDYMWFPVQHIEVKGVLQTPSRELIRQNHGLPSRLFPSDHISLAAIFQVYETEEEEDELPFESGSSASFNVENSDHLSPDETASKKHKRHSKSCNIS